LHAKNRKGLGRGPGTKEGSSRAKVTKKDRWMHRIRAVRKKLKDWKTTRLIAEDSYRQLYAVAGGGAFGSISDMERYAKTHGMWRKR